jgi:thioredoxin reductase
VSLGAPDVVVVGGGPAGLAAAVELRARGVGEVLVLEREPEAGGIPRHAHHQGFGLRDLRRAMAGPRYARRYAELAARAGARVVTEAMVTGWTPEGALDVTSPAGRETVAAPAVLLATGCRERPRSARLVPGSRPAGVMTTGMLQQLVYLTAARAGRRALVVGAEHVSFSALLTLAHGGARAVGMVTELPRHQSLGAFRVGAALRFRVPLWTRTAVTAIRGRPRVEAVELTDLDTGAVRTVECDTIVFTADWIPDHELAVLGGIELDPGTRGPAVDAGLRTSRPGVFAAGNVIHGAETADVAALSGRHAASAVAGYLATPGEWPGARAPIRCRAPLGWIAPNVVTASPERPPRARFALRAHAFLRRPDVEVRQRDRVLWTGRPRRVGPGRSSGLADGWAGSADPAGDPIEIRLVHHDLDN